MGVLHRYERVRCTNCEAVVTFTLMWGELSTRESTREPRVYERNPDHFIGLIAELLYTYPAKVRRLRAKWASKNGGGG